MKVLFLYRYGILGGVCTQIYHRMRHISNEFEVDIHCGFRYELSNVSNMLSPYAKVHFGVDIDEAVKLLNENNFDTVIIIDSEEYLEAIRVANHNATVIIEVHTSIEKNLEYLTRIRENDIHSISLSY